MGRFDKMFLSRHEMEQTRNEIIPQLEKAETPRPEPSEFLENFAKKIPGGRKALSVLVATGVLLFPLGREIFYRSVIESAHASEAAPDDVKNFENVQQFLESLEGHDIEVTVTEGVVALHVDGAGLDGDAGSTAIDVQRQAQVLEIDTNFLWGLRDYSRAEEAPGEKELLQDQVRVLMQDIEDQQKALGLDVASGIGSLNIYVDAYSSPEGTDAKNLDLSQERADEGREAVLEVLVDEYGLSAEQVNFARVQGHGEEGNLTGFVERLDAEGVNIESKTATTEQVAEAIIRGVHDGEVEDQRIIDAYNEEVASHRHTTVRIENTNENDLRLVVGDDWSIQDSAIPNCDQLRSWMIEFSMTDGETPFMVVDSGIGFGEAGLDGYADRDVLESRKTEWGIAENYATELPGGPEQEQLPPDDKIDKVVPPTETPPPPPPPPPRVDSPRVRNKQLAIWSKKYENARHSRTHQTGPGVGSVAGSMTIGRAPSRSGVEVSRKGQGRDHHSGRRTGNKTR